MRQILKKREPLALSNWRATNNCTPNCIYDAIDSLTLRVIKLALVKEQFGICAYTGRRIDFHTCHIEHAIPQDHCADGKDIDYRNMLACVPAPNTPQLSYGAHKKDNWPDPDTFHLFVSPLDNGCEARFIFSLKGEIYSGVGDPAAQETIVKLGLNNSLLTQLRKVAIERTLGIRGRGRASLDLPAARRRLTQLQQAEETGPELEPFCFALKQAIAKHIQRIKNIQRNNRERR